MPEGEAQRERADSIEPIEPGTGGRRSRRDSTRLHRLPRAGATALDGVIESARRLGVELDEAEAARWVAALEAESAGGDVVVDVDSGIYGHRVSMLDFTAGDLARFRAIGEIVGFPDRPPDVR